MGKARKKKHPRGLSARDPATGQSMPRTMVIQRGKVGRLVNSLVVDIRKVMEPYTAQKLKALKNNVLKDFLHVAGPYGVTHLLLLSKSEISANLRICRLPRGPTLTFHILSFSLCKDVISSLRHAACGQQLYSHPPLLVLSNFNTELPSMKLLATTLQNMFPSINIQAVKLSTIKRCVLFHYDQDTNSVLFRHYAIKVLPVGASRSVKKLLKRHIPDLSKYQDISDFITKDYMSESEAEDAAGEEVTLPQDLPGAGNVKQQQSAIKLTELGPRMSLQLIKMEDGVCDGEVLHHEFITKAKKDILETKRKHQQRRKLKEQRKKEQEYNVKRKQKEKTKHRLKIKSIAGQKRKLEGSETETDTRISASKKSKKLLNGVRGKSAANNTSARKTRTRPKKTFVMKSRRHGLRF